MKPQRRVQRDSTLSLLPQTRPVLQTPQIKDQGVAEKLIKEASGLAFLTVAKLGFLLGIRAGSGLVIARDAVG